MTGSPIVTVVIPSQGNSARKNSLFRAIESVKSSSYRAVSVLVVINGDQFDASVIEQLRRLRGVTVLVQDQPGLPEALRFGICHVETPYFSTLDDDDEYLPGATDLKLDALVAEPLAAVVIGDFIRRRGNLDRPGLSTELSRVRDDPLTTLLTNCGWLSSGNALYRHTPVVIEAFQNMHRFREWTCLAFDLIQAGFKVAVIDEPVFVYNLSEHSSLSRSAGYTYAGITLFQRMQQGQLTGAQRRAVARNLCDEYHHYSDILLREGRRAESFYFHLRSLVIPGGLRYLSFTRKFLIP